MREGKEKNGSESPAVLVVNIELGGIKEELRVCINEDPKEIAKRFCVRHGLELSIQDKIASYIETNMPSIKDIAPNSKKASSFYSEEKFESSSISEGRNSKKGVSKTGKGRDQHSYTSRDKRADKPTGKALENSRQLKGSRSQTLKNLKRGKSQKDRESEVEPEAKSMISAQSSKRGLADLSFKTGPCSAVYPKRSNLSEFGSRISHESEQSLNSSVGISLYRNAMESMKERSQSLKKLKKEQEQEDLKLMTFTPRINSSAYGSRLNLLQAPEDSLMERYALQQERLEKKKYERDLSLKKECPFRPRISDISNKIARKARSCRGKSKESVANMENQGDTENASGIFEALYSGAKSVSTKSLMVPTPCTFKPNISTWNYTTKREYISQPVSQRLLNSKKAKEEQMKKIREKKMFVDTNFDKKTGQMFYKPIVSRGPKQNRRDVTKPIFESLYKDTYLENKKQKSQIAAKTRMEEIKTKKYSIANSIQVLENGKKIKCEELFKLLDPDTCGKISKAHIHLDYLSTEALDLLSPILLEIESKDMTLRAQDWQKLIEPYIEKMSIEQLRKLTAGPRLKLDDEISKNLTFAPKLSKKTEQYAGKKRISHQTSKELALRLYNNNQDKQKKKAEFEEEKGKKEMTGCTFAPQVHKFKAKVFEKTPVDSRVRMYAVKRSQSKKKAQTLEVALRKKNIRL